MSYFEELPNISYVSLLPNQNRSDERIEVKNLFKRAKLRTDVDQSVTGFDYYMIQDNERPDIKLHKSFDGSHPDLLGTYLAACVLYATIYKKSSLEVDYNYFDAVSLEDQKFLQTIADKTVNEFFDR